jgi:hypothetical protein
VSYGLTAGVTTKCWSVLAQMIHELANCSSKEFAELSVQKSSSSRPARGGSPLSSAYQARSAHTAGVGDPPDRTPDLWQRLELDRGAHRAT